MDDIIKAMRVLAELSAQLVTELDSLVDESKYKDNMVITSRMAAMETFCYLGELLGKAADRLERESKTEVKYGCHCDIDDGMQPDGCVIDIGNIDGCFYAEIGMKKEDCKYWQPIKIIG